MLHDMVYRGNCDFLKGLPDFDLNTLKHAYGSMTYNNYMKYIKGAHTDDFSPRVVKTYCYCIRQILAWILIDKYDDVNAPINIDTLLERFEDEDIIGDGLLQDMRDCIDFYRSGCKSNKLSEEKILHLSKWIDTYLQVTRTAQGDKRELPNIEIYNNKFRQIINDVYLDTSYDDYLWAGPAIEHGLITEEEFIKFLNTPIKDVIGFQQFL